jgi:hypothetical protein
MKGYYISSFNEGLILSSSGLCLGVCLMGPGLLLKCVWHESSTLLGTVLYEWNEAVLDCIYNE